MATASELISNKGSAGLGTGGNPNIPVGYGKDLDVINDIGRTLTLVDLDQNRRIFEQKVRDRDRTLAAVDSGSIKVGDILEEDQPIVKEGLDNLDTVWAEWAKNPNSIEAQVKYKKALRDAQDRVTQANARFLGDRVQKSEIANDSLPRTRQARANNLQSWKKNFWGEVMPYQQQQDLDIPGSILSTAATTTTEFTDPSTFTKGKRTEFDYGKTYDANLNNYLNDVNKAYDQRQLVNALQALDPQEFTEKIDAINGRIKEYNTMKGLIPGADGYVDEVKVEYDPATGRGIINERLPDFSAKFTLANQKPFGGISTELDRGALDIARQKEIERHNKALEALQRGRLSLNERQFNFQAQKAGATQQMAESAKKYAESLFSKLKGLANEDGIIPKGSLSQLTVDELKYLGSATTTENKFSLDPLDMKNVTSLVISPNGTISVYEKGTKKSLGSQIGGRINTTTIATNKLGDEMVQTTGKEGYNFNDLIPLYGEENDNEDNNYYDNEGNVESITNDEVRYKDGSVWKIDDKTGKMIKVK